MSLHPTTFSYLKPTEKQLDTMTGLREDFTRFAEKLQQALPDGPDKTWIIREFRTIAMWTMVALTREQDGSPRE